MVAIEPASDLRGHMETFDNAYSGFSIFMQELEQGRRSGDEESWLSESDVRIHFAERGAAHMMGSES